MRTGSKAGLLIWPGLFWVLAFLIPLGAVAFRAAGAPGELAAIAVSPYYRGIFGFTVKQAALSTLFSVLLGLPGAALAARCEFPGRRLLKSLTTVPFVLPSILAVLGFILVFGNAGLINAARKALFPDLPAPWRILYSLKAIIMAHVFYNFPLTLRIVGDAWAGLDSVTERAARSLGAGRGRVFLQIDLPRLLPSILTASLLTFIYCFLSFSIILVLGGGPELATLEVEVYRLVKYSLDFGRGSALALYETVFIIAMMAAYTLVNRWSSRDLTDGGKSALRERSRLRGASAWSAGAYLIPAVLFILLPLAAVVFHSFVGRTTRTGPPTATLNHWIRLFGGGRTRGSIPLEAMLRTLMLGLGAGTLTTITAALTSWYAVTAGGRRGRIVDSMVSLPLAISSVILGLGYLIVTNRLPNVAGLRISALLTVHTVLALPFAHRIISDRLREISPRIRQAARSSGAGPLKAFIAIELPLARRSLITAAVFATAISAGEMNATLVLAPTNFTTMPIAIYRMIGAYDIYGACALGTMLIAISTAAFFTLDRFAEESI